MILSLVSSRRGESKLKVVIGLAVVVLAVEGPAVVGPAVVGPAVVGPAVVHNCFL